jgi:hypothetical protein
LHEPVKVEEPTVRLQRCGTMTWDYTLSLPLGALVGLASVAFLVGLVLH